MSLVNTYKMLVTVVLVAQLMHGCGWYEKSKKKSSDHSEGIDPSLSSSDRKEIVSGMKAADLALAAFNPSMAHACEGQLTNLAYQGLVDSLGGIQFGQSLRFFRNTRVPYLVSPQAKGSSDEGGDIFDADVEAVGKTDGASPGDPVDIKRADLIGHAGSKVVFLSKTHGLFFVETAGDQPRMTCTLMVPGDPKNFYIVNNHLILINNSVWSRHASGTASAVIVYSISDSGLAYKAHHVLTGQIILDSRLFNETLVTYAQFQRPRGFNLYSEVVASRTRSQEYMVTAFSQITETPKVMFEDILSEKNEETSFPNGFTQADVGKVSGRHVGFKDFISASDRYFVITKEVQETVVEKVIERRYRHTYCAQYNPKSELVKHSYCAPQWSKVANPDFDSRFSCHAAQSFASCVQENESKFIKAYWTYQGSSCQEHSYWVGRCERYETKSELALVPSYQTKTVSHLMIYKYENGNFVRFDDPSGAAPIVVEGSIKEHKSFQFRDGYLMIVTSDRITGSALRSWKLADKALVYAGAVEKMGPGEDLKAVLFTDKEAYVVTFLRKDPLFRIDLNDPSKPVLTGKLDVEGFSSQLIYSDGKLIGIGETAEWSQNRVKVSLFEAGAHQFLSEITSIALGQDLEHSHNNASYDDQLHHFVPKENRLYVPYSGWYQRQASDTFSQVCRVGYRYPKHRVGIFHVGATLVEDADLDFRGNIERVLEYQAGRALAFSSGAVTQIKEQQGKFVGVEVKELYQTEGIYLDASLPEHMVVAKQVVRTGYQMHKLRFALGTREQLIRNEPVHVIEIQDELVSCLGNPEVQFYDNELYVGHNLNHFRPRYQNYRDVTEVQISGMLGWRIGADGFQPLNVQELAAHRARQAAEMEE